MVGTTAESRHPLKRPQEPIRTADDENDSSSSDGSSSDISTDLSTASSSSDEDEESVGPYLNESDLKRRKLQNGSIFATKCTTLNGNGDDDVDDSNVNNVRVNPSLIPYEPVKLTEKDDELLRREMAANLIKGYLYYEHLWIALSKVITTFIKDNRFMFTIGRLRQLKYTDWETFSTQYRSTIADKEKLRYILPNLDIVAVGHSAVKMRRVLIDILNHLYIGYTKGSKEFDKEFSKKLVSYSLGRKPDTINTHYHNLLVREFNEFFDLRSGYGNTMDKYVTQESFYISNGSFRVKDTQNSLEWTPVEKDAFYEGLARYGIHRADEIADAIPNKSIADVMTLYGILQKELKRYKSSDRLRKKLITLSEVPIAYEMSEEYIAVEEKMAYQIEKKDILPQQLEQRANDAKELFDMEQIRTLLLINQEMATLDDFEVENAGPQISIAAVTTAYDIVITLIYEICFKLFLRKINRFSLGQLQAWSDIVKATAPLPDPYKMVSVFRGFGDPINFEIKPDDLYDPNADDGADTDNDNYFPNNLPSQMETIRQLDPNNILIPDNLDSSEVTISKSDIKEVCDEIFGSKGGTDALLKILTGEQKLHLKDFRKQIDLKRKKDQQSQIPGLDEMIVTDGDESDNVESETDDETQLQNASQNMKSRDPLNDFHSDNSDHDHTFDGGLGSDMDLNFDSENDTEENTTPKYGDDAIMGKPVSNEHIDELSSEEDVQEDSKTDWYLSHSKEIKYDDLVFSKEAFVVPNGVVDNEALSESLSKRFDFTTEGHEYLQALVDEEEFRTDKKDRVDSLKYENLQLALLTSLNANDRDYAEVFSILKYGGPMLSAESWDAAQGGPIPQLKDEKTVESVHDVIYKADMKDPLPPCIQVSDDDMKTFEKEYNEY